MAPRVEFIFFLVLSIFSVQVFSQTKYDLFWLVQQWPPAVCSGKKCTYGSLQMFTIHGFWPQNNSGSSPLNCRAPQFDRNKITGGLKTDMNRYWPDVINGNNNKFWAHEWNKHGTCSYGILDQVKYFTVAVQKRIQFDLVSILAGAHIIPNGSTYNLDSIKTAVRASTGRRPGVRCDAKSRRMLNEIVLCYNKAATSLIDCTRADRCGSSVTW